MTLVHLPFAMVIPYQSTSWIRYDAALILSFFVLSADQKIKDRRFGCIETIVTLDQ
jgi:hypothetical protein